MTPNGMGLAAITKASAPALPSRASTEPALAPVSPIADNESRSPVSGDPYGQLSDLDFANGGGGTGGGYETDMPQPRGGEEDLLF